MIVAEAIDYFRGKEIKIGSGVGFVYCGTCYDFMPRIMDYLSKRELNDLKAKHKKAVMMLDTLDDRYSLKIERCVESFAGEGKSQSKIDKKIKDIEKQKQREKTQLTLSKKNYLNKIINFSYFNLREVTEIYKSIDRNVNIIIFEGKEIGQYWDAEEFKRDEKMRRIIDGFRKSY